MGLLFLTLLKGSMLGWLGTNEGNVQKGGTQVQTRRARRRPLRAPGIWKLPENPLAPLTGLGDGKRCLILSKGEIQELLGSDEWGG